MDSLRVFSLAFTMKNIVYFYYIHAIEHLVYNTMGETVPFS